MFFSAYSLFGDSVHDAYHADEDDDNDDDDHNDDHDDDHNDDELALCLLIGSNRLLLRDCLLLTLTLCLSVY